MGTGMEKKNVYRDSILIHLEELLLYLLLNKVFTVYFTSLMLLKAINLLK